MKAVSSLIFAISLFGTYGSAPAQGVRPQPYSGQLRTDPAVGNVQGIQRYGRPMKTDPEEGEGFSYHVYPVAYPPPPSLFPATGVAESGGGSPVALAKQPPSQIELAREVRELEQLIGKYQGQPLESTLRKLHEEKKSKLDSMVSEIQSLNQRISGLRRTLEENQDPAVKEVVAKAMGDAQSRVKSLQGESTTVEGKALWQGSSPAGTVNWGQAYAAPPSPYPPPFDATAGIRNMDLPPVGPPPASLPDGPAAKALAITRTGLTYVEGQIYHQPLIQVKLRVVEVARGNQLQTSSVLDYISNRGQASLVNGNNVNDNRRRTTGLTRFPAGSLIDVPAQGGTIADISSGSGMLVNLTTAHINYLARLLATEFHGDLVTAPEVVTLNGQNVEFVAGSKLPFALGQNVILGNTANVQQYFYKNVGTFVSVTPRIVNWGLHGEGEGSAVVGAGEIANWDAAALWAINHLAIPTEDAKLIGAEIGKLFSIENKTRLLNHLKRYSKQELRERGFPLRCMEPGGCPCDWNPKDCTIDLAVVVRTSDSGTITISSKDGDRTIDTSVPTEQDVRAVANVIQIKSGHGVVMAGLIGERDIQEISKVPLLGDLPLLGFFFRSKGTNRQKTELLIFLEAEVLDTRPEYARARSAGDFVLGQPYVSGEFLDNPLECGIHRAGVGSYLPPLGKDEQVFWERFGRKVRKMGTTLHDMFE